MEIFFSYARSISWKLHPVLLERHTTCSYSSLKSCFAFVILKVWRAMMVLPMMFQSAEPVPCFNRKLDQVQRLHPRL